MPLVFIFFFFGLLTHYVHFIDRISNVVSIIRNFIALNIQNDDALEKANERKREIKKRRRELFILLWHELDGEMDKYPVIKYPFDGYYVNNI